MVKGADVNPRLRNTNEWYDSTDPLSVVDMSLVHQVHRVAGAKVLDVGCGLGGYSKVLQQRGHDCMAIDVNNRYVGIAQSIGVRATLFDGEHIPFPDQTFDSAFAIEVLEHVKNPERLLAEVKRVTRHTFVATVPNCTQTFGSAGVVFDHMLDIDHKNFFTVDSLSATLHQSFESVHVVQIMPVNRMLATATLPAALSLPYRALLKLGLLRPTHYFRLLAVCRTAKE